jgi:para-nitrobenzyl esterase
VRGRPIDGIHTFKRIPYGAPTAGANRWTPPKLAKRWTGVCDEFEYAHRTPKSSPARSQKQPEFFGILRAASTAGAGEDCLNPSVWTEGVSDGGKRPVMHWIHRGGYDQGSSGTLVYHGAGLAGRQHAVVVSVNHRLNALGYLFLGDLGGPTAGIRGPSTFEAVANVGELDLIASLAWVRDKIRAFGGDLGKAMIFGQSGGDQKVSTLLGNPSAQRSAIAGGASLRGVAGGAANQTTEKLLKALSLRSGQGRELQDLPLDERMAAARTGNGFGPVVDGKVLPAHPFDPVASPISPEVPVMVGSTRTGRTVV